MKQLIFSLSVLLFTGGVASAQSLKAPPVTVDDRLTALEDRVAVLEKLFQKGNAVTSEKPAEPVPTVQAAPIYASVPATYTTVPGYTTRIVPFSTLAPSVCGPNGCGVTTTIRFRR